MHGDPETKMSDHGRHIRSSPVHQDENGADLQSSLEKGSQPTVAGDFATFSLIR